MPHTPAGRARSKDRCVVETLAPVEPVETTGFDCAEGGQKPPERRTLNQPTPDERVVKVSTAAHISMGVKLE